MTQKLKIENGPEKAELLKTITNKDGVVVLFDAGGDACEAGVENLAETDSTGTSWQITGLFKLGKLKGKSFAGTYNAKTRKGLFDVGNVPVGAESRFLAREEDIAA